jgi:hypothetical protein
MARWIGLALVLAVATTAAAAPETVWQTGRPDRSYMEFAVAKNHAAWETRFGAKDPVFEVGKSDPGKDWPFIHPGPSDPWAGGREHPLPIRFGLEAEPRGVFTLRIGFADVHARGTPTYVVRVGGRPGGVLAPGAGSLAAVAEPNVRLVAAKRADAGAGLVLRLWEVGGRATTAHVRLPQMKPTKATACNLVEEPQGAPEIEDGAISVPVRGRGLATVLVE